LAANTASTITVEARSIVTNATLKVSDDAGNFATATRSVSLGTAGGDSIPGSNSADLIFGFEGNDTITGGAGADTFVLAGNDTVVDFNSTETDTVDTTGLANADAVTFTTVTGTLDLSGSTTTAAFTRDCPLAGQVVS